MSLKDTYIYFVLIITICVTQEYLHLLHFDLIIRFAQGYLHLLCFDYNYMFHPRTPTSTYFECFTQGYLYLLCLIIIICFTQGYLYLLCLIIIICFTQGYPHTLVLVSIIMCVLQNFNDIAAKLQEPTRPSCVIRTGAPWVKSCFQIFYCEVRI